LYCIVLYCIVLYCIVLYCIVLYCIVLYCIVLYTLASASSTSSCRDVRTWFGACLGAACGTTGLGAAAIVNDVIIHVIDEGGAVSGDGHLPPHAPSV
jgi:hypothetical protein